MIVGLRDIEIINSWECHGSQERRFRILDNGTLRFLAIHFNWFNNGFAYAMRQNGCLWRSWHGTHWDCFFGKKEYYSINLAEVLWDDMILWYIFDSWASKISERLLFHWDAEIFDDKTCFWWSVPFSRLHIFWMGPLNKLFPSDRKIRNALPSNISWKNFAFLPQIIYCWILKFLFIRDAKDHHICHRGGKFRTTLSGILFVFWDLAGSWMSFENIACWRPGNNH